MTYGGEAGESKTDLCLGLALADRIAGRPEARLGQLTAVRFEMTPNGIKAENKEDVVKRLDRSPDRADAVVMCWYRGVTGAYARKLYGIDGSGRTLPEGDQGVRCCEASAALSIPITLLQPWRARLAK